MRKKHDPLLIRCCPWILLTGGILSEVWRLTQISIFLVGLPLLFIGACGGALQKYRSERGLWMLSTLIGVMIGLFVAAAIWGIAEDIVRFGLKAPESRSELFWLASIAVVITYMLFAVVKITTHNWKFSKRSARQNLNIGRRQRDFSHAR